MKQKLVTLALAALSFGAFAQDDMSTVWEVKLEHKIDGSGTGSEHRGHSYAYSEKEFTVFNNADGKTLWTKAFKDIAPTLRKVDEVIPLWMSDAVILFDKKMGKDQAACIDLKTGELLWSSDRYQLSTFIKANAASFEQMFLDVPEKDGFIVVLKEELIFVDARSGVEKWSTSKFKGLVGEYVYKDGYMVAVNFKPGWLGALFSGYKNQIVKINMDNGDIVWDQEYIGRAEQKVITKEFLFELDVHDNMVVLRMNGIQTYDFKTGAKLWAAAFDFSAEKIVGEPAGAKKFGVYGAVADPVIHGDDIYVLDMSGKKSQFIKKYDKNTGKLLWTSNEIKGAKAIPNMFVVDDKVVLQIGGVIEAQAYIRKRQGEEWIEEWKVWYPDVKPWGLQAFNTSDGSKAWDSEKFKKGITNSFAIDGNVVVSSGKALYSIKVASGDVNYEVSLKDDGISTGEGLRLYKDKAIVIGKKGVSSHNISDGKLVSSAKYKQSYLEDMDGDYLIMKTDKADIACYDLRTVKYKQFKAKKGATTSLSTDQKYVYVYENKVVTKLKTE